MLVRPFDPKQWPKGELFFDVLNILGATPAGIDVGEPANEGLDYRAVELLRQLNVQNNKEHGRDRTKPRWRQLHDQHRRMAGELSRMLSESQGKEKLTLSYEQAEILRAHFRQNNIAALKGSGVDVDTFFPPASPDREARIKPEDMTPGLLLPLLVQLVERQTKPEPFARNNARK